MDVVRRVSLALRAKVGLCHGRGTPWNLRSTRSTVISSSAGMMFPSASGEGETSTVARWTAESRRVGLLARKVGMMNSWEADGTRVTLTVLCVDRCHVLQVKEPHPQQRRPWYGVQVGAGPKRPYQVAKPQRYHFAKAGVEPKQKVVEFQVTPDALLPPGTELRATHFVVGQKVDVTGTSIGKGFQGPMKRWGFGGLPASHGVSKAHRSHGSTGQRSQPGKIFKGKKMAGQMGRKRVTVQSLNIWKVDGPRNLLWLKGHVPGHSGNWVRVFDATRARQVVTPPFPTCLSEPQPNVQDYVESEWLSARPTVASTKPQDNNVNG
mmetsp:Transcript_12025/g.24489  ORF Transcript_12025/g.24489 Transcript_12025/m.24489 type:complete len:322 (-) Transcript_12025:678-1643(-)